MIRRILLLAVLAMVVGAVVMAVQSRADIERYRRIKDM